MAEKETTDTRNEIQLLTAKDLAMRLSLSKRQVFRLNSCGKLPRPLRIAGSTRWVESTIAEWLKCGAPDRRTFEALQGGEMV